MQGTGTSWASDRDSLVMSDHKACGLRGLGLGYCLMPGLQLQMSQLLK
jgi:hypothetical protein